LTRPKEVTFIASLEDTIAYLVHRYAELQPRRPLTRTKLMKLLYLCDLEAVRARHQPLTEVRWKSYYYGPYSSDVTDAADALDGRVIVERVGSQVNGQPFYWYEPVSGPVPTPNLSKLEQDVLEHVLATYGPMPLTRLLDHVYATEPYKNAEKLGDLISLKGH
jgi:uncharacterized phage-associated protein